MIEALLHGKIARTPEQRQAKNGNTFTVSSMTVSSNNGLIFVSVIAFDDEVQADLLQLTKGDKASVSGTLSPNIWIDNNGEPQVNLDITVNHVLTVYSGRNKRRKNSTRTISQ